MSWIEDNKQIFRMVILLLLVLAFLGPWAFASLKVPAEYDCDPPNIQLESNICGLPISMMQILAGMFSNGFNSIFKLISGEIDLDQSVPNFWFLINYLVIVLLTMPIFNLLFLILRGDRPRLQKFHWGVCGLNLILVLLAGLSIFPKIYLAHWGAWLYVGVMIGILILEGVLLKLQRSKNVSRITPPYE